MNRRIQILSVLLLLTLASAVRAQTPLSCGIVGIDGPSEVDPGIPAVFKVRTANLHTTKPEFKWKLSAGTITTGEGTEEITVDTSWLGGLDLIATVELLGVPPGCNGSTSKTTRVKVPPLVCGLAFDRYGDIKFEDEEARLDNFAIQLTNLPLSSGHILMSAGKETFKNEVREHLNRVKSYLVNVREINPNRIVTVDCGFSQELDIQLIIVPPGVKGPECVNVGVVPFSEVKFTKTRPKAGKARKK